MKITSAAFVRLRAAADIGDSHSLTPRNSKSTRISWHLARVHPCAGSKPRQKAVLGCEAAAGDACGEDRTGPILCGGRLCCSQSQRGLLTKWRTSRSSSIQTWRHELTCIRSQKSSRIYTPPCMIYHRIYTSMDISAELIAAAMGKARNGQCEVVGRDLFASPTGCRLSTVARVCEVV